MSALHIHTSQLRNFNFAQPHLTTILGTLKKASAAAFQGTGSDPLQFVRHSVQPFLRPRDARLRPAAAGSRRVGGRRCSPTISPCAIDLPAPFAAARLDARALRRSCSRTLNRASSCKRSTDRWRGARARPVQVRRRRRRRSAPRGATGAESGASACGLTPTEAAAAAAMEATCARHRRNATVSSASLRSPRGARAIGRVGSAG